MAPFGRRRVLLVLTSPAQLQPVHRGREVEEPLVELLARWPGAAIVGAGTHLDAESRISGFTIEIAVPARASKDVIEAVTRFLALRVPVGSQLESSSGEVSPVGQLEGLVLRFTEIVEVDFTDPDEVQHNRELDGILARVTQALRSEPLVASWRVMNADSEIAIYGRSGERMRDLIQSRLGEELALHRAHIRRSA